MLQVNITGIFRELLATERVPEVGLLVLEELPQLVTGAHQEVGVGVHVDDEVDGLEEHGVLGVGVLHLLRLGRLLGLVQDSLQALRQPRANARVLCVIKKKRKEKGEIVKPYKLLQSQGHVKSVPLM